MTIKCSDKLQKSVRVASCSHCVARKHQSSSEEGVLTSVATIRNPDLHISGHESRRKLQLGFTLLSPRDYLTLYREIRKSLFLPLSDDLPSHEVIGSFLRH